MFETRNRDLLAICAWAAVTLLVVENADNQLLRLMFAWPLLLFFSGHAVLRALGPIATSRAEHVVYTIGVSLFVALAGGFLLNRLGMLVPRGWALWLLGVVAASTAAALLRQPKTGVPLGEQFGIPGFGKSHLATIGLAAVLVCGAYALSVRDASREQEFKYVQFWMVGAERGAGSFVVGIKSAEPQPQLFDIEITRDAHVIASWRAVRLDPGETWTHDLALGIDPQDGRKIRARLYDHDDGRLYRQVTAIVPSA